MEEPKGGKVHIRSSPCASPGLPVFLFLHFLHPPPPPPTMPRSSSLTALAAILVIGTFLLFRRLSAPPAFYRDAFGFGRSRSLRTWLRDEEVRYAEVVQSRQELIRKWGPTDVQVES